MPIERVQPDGLPESPLYASRTFYRPYERLGAHWFGGDWFAGHHTADGAFWVEAKTGQWHNLRLSIRGPMLEAFFDNRRFLSAREDEWQHSSYKHGKIGLWARGPGVVYFDNVRLTRMDEGTGSVPLGGTETTIIK